jgi:hypothetical protein
MAPINADSGVFMYIGNVINAGGYPYLDAWDHKGPALYLLNSLLLYVGGIYFVTFMEGVLFISSMLYCNYLFKNVINERILTVIFASFVISYFYFFQYGNYTETWTMPLQLIVYSYFLSLLINKKPVSNRFMFMLGTIIAFVLLMRPNNAIGLLFVLLLSIYSSQTKRIALLYSTLGGLLISTPILLWLFYGGAIGDFVDQYYNYNMIYSGEGKSIVSGFVRPTEQLLRTTLLPSLLSLTGLVYLFGKLTFIRNKVFLFLIALFVIDFVFAHISFREYLHYNVIVLPSLLMLSLYVGYKTNNLSFKIKKKIPILFLVLLLPSISYTSWKIISETRITVKHLSYGTTSNTRLIADWISKNTSSDDIIHIHGFGTRYMVFLDKISPLKYVYVYPLITPGFAKAAYADYISSLDRDPPTVIIESSLGSCSNFPDNPPGHLPIFCEWLRSKYVKVGSSDPIKDLYTSTPLVLWRYKI